MAAWCQHDATIEQRRTSVEDGPRQLLAVIARPRKAQLLRLEDGIAREGIELEEGLAPFELEDTPLAESFHRGLQRSLRTPALVSHSVHLQAGHSAPGKARAFVSTQYSFDLPV